MTAVWSPLLESYPLAAGSDGAVLQDLAAEASAATIVCPLPGHGILKVEGPDASKFLQGQATTDFREVSDTTSRLGCYVNLKGRAIASFRAVQQGEAIRLVMAAGLPELVKEKLGKYIIFSKASLALDGDTALLGLAGPAAEVALADAGVAVPPTVDAVSHGNGLSCVRLSGEQRFLLLVQAGQLQGIWDSLTLLAHPAGSNAWRLRQIGAGEAEVVPAASELFQPQELNFPLLGGVSYTKGCYTGQEIVARLHFRGKLKQHVQRFAVSAHELPAPGSSLFTAEGKAAGDVVLAARRDAHTVELLAIARPEQAQVLHLGSAEGPPLQALALPYVVPTTE